MKEAVRDKMLELIQSGKKILENDVDVLDLIDTSDLYGMINEASTITINVTKQEKWPTAK